MTTTYNDVPPTMIYYPLAQRITTLKPPRLRDPSTSTPEDAIPLYRHLRIRSQQNSTSTTINQKHPSDSQISLYIGPQNFLPVDTTFLTTPRTDNRHFPTTPAPFCFAQLYRPIENRYNKKRPHLQRYTARGHTVRQRVYK